MSLEEKFKSACDSVRKFTKRPQDADMLELYSLYKQATIGDNNNAKPADDTGKLKWEAWTKKKGLDNNKAKELYIEKYKVLAGKCA